MGAFTVIFCASPHIPAPGEILEYLAQHDYSLFLVEDIPGTFDIWSDVWRQVVLNVEYTEDAAILLNCITEADNIFDRYIEQWIDITNQANRGCNFLFSGWRKRTINHLQNTRYIIELDYPWDTDPDLILLLIDYFEQNFGGLVELNGL